MTDSNLLTKRKNKLFGVYYIFWKVNYPDDQYIDCSKINKVQFLTKLWEKLPFTLDGESETTGLTCVKITEALNQKYGIDNLCGKDMKTIGGYKWKYVPTMYLDLVLGFGMTKVIYRSCGSSNGSGNGNGPESIFWNSNL